MPTTTAPAAPPGASTAPSPAAETPGATSAPTPAPRPSPARTSITEYFLLDSGSGPQLVPVPRAIPSTTEVGGASLHQLLTGPNGTEAAGGLVTAVPPGALVSPLVISEGVATVDLSGEFASGGTDSDFEQRVAQVVYTLTQFHTVTSVLFEVEGQPIPVLRGDGSSTSDAVGRGDYVGLVPPIFVESPRWGDGGTNPVAVAGRSNTESGTFTIEIQAPDGTVLGSADVTSSCGTNCWADFATQVAYTATAPGPGRLVVYSHAPSDGRTVDQRAYPIQLVPGG